MTAFRTIVDGLGPDALGAAMLLGARCSDCGVVTFPRQDACPRCSSSMLPIELGQRGRLWTWTIQRFRPKSPPYAGPDDEGFEPYGVGYVELPGQARVEGHLTVNDPARLAIGMEMELVMMPFGTTENGDDVFTYAFRPVTEETAG